MGNNGRPTPPVWVLLGLKNFGYHREESCIETLFLSYEDDEMTRSNSTNAARTVSLEKVQQFAAEFGEKSTEYLVEGLSIEQARARFATTDSDKQRQFAASHGDKRAIFASAMKLRGR